MGDDLCFDSSELLYAENYKGTIREVALMKGNSFSSLPDAQEHAIRNGFVLYDTGIVNIVCGEPQNNEPRPVLLFSRPENIPGLGSCLADALIVRSEMDFLLYELGSGFRYVQ